MLSSCYGAEPGVARPLTTRPIPNPQTSPESFLHADCMRLPSWEGSGRGGQVGTCRATNTETVRGEGDLWPICKQHDLVPLFLNVSDDKISQIIFLDVK